jgi:hypothetical protein
MNQQDATVSQVYYLTFMCGLTCFGRFLAHHRELTTALAASGFTVKNSFTSLLLDVYVWLNMFWTLSRPSSGAYNCISSL